MSRFQKQSDPSTIRDSNVSEASSIKQFNSNDQSYFHMMEIVGTSGKYQTYSLILWCIIWFIAGQLLLGTPFLLYNPPFENCPEGIKQTCNQFVCKNVNQPRQKYLNPKFQSLAMQFGDYHCQNSYKIQLTSSLVYFGSFLGYLIVSWMNDNLGRKRSILIGLLLTIFGILLVATSINLPMAQVGIFLAGFGIDPSINTVFYFIAETLQNKSRQKHSTLIQFFFSFAGIVNVVNYLIFKNWRIIFWTFCVVPALISIILIYWFIQQTPQFMIMFYSPQQTIIALKKIAISNGSTVFGNPSNQHNLYIHIQKLKNTYNQKQKISNKTYFNIWDMFKYPSIRFISIYVCILSFNIYLMYYGPLMLIQKYKLNIFVSSAVVCLSDVLVYPIAYFWIQKMERKIWAKIFFGISIACSIGLFFIMGSNDDFLKVIQMILIFIFRFAISFEFAVFNIYGTQLFPAQIKGIAIGFASALGTVASTLSPILFGQLQKTSFPIMLIFIFFGLLSFICSFNLPQTLNKKLPQQLQQFGQYSQQNQNKSQKGNNKDIQLVQELAQGQLNSKNQYKEKIIK